LTHRRTMSRKDVCSSVSEKSMRHPGQLEKVACGAFSDSSFVSGRKRRDFCGLHSAA
jgi:hypothetical protein